MSSRLSLCMISESGYSLFSLYLLVYSTCLLKELMSSSLWSMKITCTDLLFSRNMTACFDLNHRLT